MKKYKIHWSFFNLLSASQEEVVKLQMLWATIAGTITASTFIASSDRNTLITAAICAIVDKIILGCFYFEEKINTNSPDKP